MDFALDKRQATVEGNNDIYLVEIWFSPIAVIKWLIVGGITLLFMIWFIGGYLHAKRRVRKGLKPLFYHRFLLRHDQRIKFEPQNNFSFYRPDNHGHRIDDYGPPPPVYNPERPTPPNSLIPQVALRTDRSQDWNASPSGAPPRGIAADVEAGVQSGPKSSH